MSDWQPSPFIKLMGVRIVSRTPERSEAEVVNREDLCNRRKVMHGGAIMALADIMGGMTATAGLPAGSRTATIESKTNFFAAVPKGDMVQDSHTLSRASAPRLAFWMLWMPACVRLW